MTLEFAQETAAAGVRVGVTWGSMPYAAWLRLDDPDHGLDGGADGLSGFIFDEIST